MNSSLSRGLSILDLLVAEARPLKLGEIADALSGSKSGLHALLSTLVECGYVERLPGGIYQLGLKAWNVGNAFPTTELVHVARPIMEALVEEVGEGAILGVLNGFEATYVHLVESRHAVRVHAQVGDRIPANSTSAGQALLAFQDRNVLERILPGKLPGLSAVTIVDREELMAELARIRARGYSINRGGWNAEVGGIAAPVFGMRGTPIAALCVALPLFRMSHEWIRKVAPVLLRKAAEIGEGVGSLTSAPRKAST